jgi:hypothetical protein
LDVAVGEYILVGTFEVTQIYSFHCVTCNCVLGCLLLHGVVSFFLNSVNHSFVLPLITLCIIILVFNRYSKLFLFTFLIFLTDFCWKELVK